MRVATRQLVWLSILVSLNIILTRIASIRLALGGTEFLCLGFGSFPVILAGVLLGPKSGAVVGALGDLIGYQLHPGGVFMPHFTLVAALGGFIPGLLFRWLNRRGDYRRLTLIVLSTQTVTSILLTPWLLNLLFGIPLAVTIPPRLVALAVIVPAYVYLGQLLLKRLPVVARYAEVKHQA